MTLLDALCIVGFSAASAIVTETLGWLLMYRTEEYKRVKEGIDRAQKRLDAAKSETKTIDKQRAQLKKIARFESDLADMNRQMSMVRFKGMFFNTFTLIATFAIMSNLFDGVVVAKLPFTPFGLLQGLSHRNLVGDDYTDCSMIFLYAMSSLGIRANITKLFGNAPPKQASPFAQAWAQADSTYNS